MNMDLSLMADLFGASFDQRFNEEEKRCEKETNLNFYYVRSINRLKLIFSRDNNERIATSCA